jgi:hypothetical protein
MISEMTASDEDRAPICPYCGVTAMPAESDRSFDPRFICENPECDAFGEIVLQGDLDG